MQCAFSDKLMLEFQDVLHHRDFLRQSSVTPYVAIWLLTCKHKFDGVKNTIFLPTVFNQKIQWCSHVTLKSTGTFRPFSLWSQFLGNPYWDLVPIWRGTASHPHVSLVSYVSRSMLTASPWHLWLNGIIFTRIASLSMLYAFGLDPFMSLFLQFCCKDLKYTWSLMTPSVWET